MRAFVAMLFLVPSLACGGSDAQCVIDTDCPLFNRCMDQQCVPVGGDTDSGVPDSGTLDSGTTDSGIVDAATDSGPVDRGRGVVQLIQTPNPVMTTHTISAVFTAAGAPDGCTTTALDSCTLTECLSDPAPADGGVPDAGTPSYPSAGRITITGGLVDVAITPEADGTYPPLGGVGTVFAGGESLTTTAAGEGVPAFTGSVPSPYAITITAPSFMMPPLVVDRSSELTVSWTSAESDPGLVLVLLTGGEPRLEGGFRNVSLSCVYAGTAGTATVTTAQLMNLPGGGASGTLSIGSSNTQRIDASGWATDLVTSFVATTDTGNPALAPIAFP